ncbi:MAG TPA: transporter [Chitinophagales bacterium]|nr:transporter [Chitinophagales bacterium]
MKRVLVFTFCCVTTFLFSQEKEGESIGSISTDRPDQTETPDVVPFKYFQMETGFNVESQNKQLSFVHPTILWKAGIFKSTEIRLITDLGTMKDDSGRYRTGLAPVQIGFKTSICDERKARPKISFIAHMAVPYISTKDQRTRYFAPNFRFTLEHTLKKNLILGYNVGMEWDGESPYPSFIYTIVNGIDITDKWYFYYEFFGDIPVDRKSTHTFDGGFAYLIRNNMQIDISGGFQLYPFVKGWYTSLGYSFRLPR